MSAAFYQDEVKFYVAVDCIILGFNNKELNVLLYKRSFEPMKGQWSLMGGFVKSGESVNEAASRVLTDCTGIEHLFMEQIGAYGDVSRDLGERVISVAYYSLVNMNDFSPGGKKVLRGLYGVLRDLVRRAVIALHQTDALSVLQVNGR